MELRVGNKYRLGRKIGSGSFGDIYLGKLDQCDFDLNVIRKLVVLLFGIPLILPDLSC